MKSLTHYLTPVRGYTPYPVYNGTNFYQQCFALAAKLTSILGQRKSLHKNVVMFCRGTSGVSIVSNMVAWQKMHRPELNWLMCVVKYPNTDPSHRNMRISYPHETPHVNDVHLVVDDFMATGKTVREIFEAVYGSYDEDVRIEGLVMCSRNSVDIELIHDEERGGNSVPAHLVKKLSYTLTLSDL